MKHRTCRGSLLLLMVSLMTTPVRAGLLVNGGFESGDLTGWTSSGFFSDTYAGSGPPNYSTFLSAQATTSPMAPTNGVEPSQTSNFDGLGPPDSTPAIAPVEGSYIAFVSNQTFAGFGSLTGSSITQTFMIPLGARSLDLSLQFLSNEPTPENGGNNDFGGVALTQGSNLLSEYDIALDPNSTANAYSTYNTDQGGFYDSSGWLLVSLNVAGLGGQTVTLTAYSLNTGDDYGESRLLVDNVHVSAGASAAPEPSTLGGVAFGVLLIAGTAWRRHRRMQG